VIGGTIEIITGRERRRRWSIEEKLQIVAETEEAGARVTEVAARHGVYPGLLFTWRRQVRDGMLVAPAATGLMPVRMLATETAADPEVRNPASGERNTPVAPHLRDATIEITLANGCRLRVDPQIDVRALRRIVGVLRG
jgi:transposase